MLLSAWQKPSLKKYQLDVSIRHVGSGARAGQPRIRVVDVALAVDGLGVVELEDRLAELRILLVFYALGIRAAAVVVRGCESYASQGWDLKIKANILR